MREERAELAVRQMRGSRRHELRMRLPSGEWETLTWVEKLQCFSPTEIRECKLLTPEEVYAVLVDVPLQLRGLGTQSAPMIRGPSSRRPTTSARGGPSFWRPTASTEWDNSSFDTYDISEPESCLSHRGVDREFRVSEGSPTFQMPRARPMARSRSFTKVLGGATLMTAAERQLERRCNRKSKSADEIPEMYDMSIASSEDGSFTGSHGGSPFVRRPPMRQTGAPDAILAIDAVPPTHEALRARGPSSPPGARLGSRTSLGSRSSASGATSTSNIWTHVPGFARFTESHSFVRSAIAQEQADYARSVQTLRAKHTENRRQSEDKLRAEQVAAAEKQRVSEFNLAARRAEVVYGKATEYDRQFLPADYHADMLTAGTDHLAEEVTPGHPKSPNTAAPAAAIKMQAVQRGRIGRRISKERELYCL